MVTCTRYRPVNKGCIIGTCNIVIPTWGIEFFDITLFENGNQRWVTFPSRQYERDGKKNYMPYFRFQNKTDAEMFADKVFEAVARYNAGDSKFDDDLIFSNFN